MKKIGFIGAGKCGMSLAYYFRSKGISMSGFSPGRTNSESCGEYISREELIARSGIIFITVTDSAIQAVWNGLRKYDLTDKIICHCSGSLSSDIFSGAIPETVCSVHPMLAFNSRHTSIDDISKAFFTLEGGEYAVNILSQLLKSTGNSFKIIEKCSKAKYHAAACFASNFVVSVCSKAEQLLCECGFSPNEAHRALSPMMLANMQNIISCGTQGALTGPAARGDFATIDRHIAALGNDADLYRLLTKVILDMKGRYEYEDDNSRIYYGKKE